MQVRWPVWADTRAKKLAFVTALQEKLRRLHNAVGKWQRGDALTAEGSALLQDRFPGQWPTPPTAAQADQWRGGWFEKRSMAIGRALSVRRRAASRAEFDLVDFDGAFDGA